jgi:uncharacterized membrane protein YeaQ/YmgE (transglycosylase-associated protein family)
MLNIAFWVVFGFLTGWIGEILVGPTARRTVLIVLSGVFGGMVGGAFIQLLTEGNIMTTYNPNSLFGATLIAIIAVSLVTRTTNPRSAD